MQRVTKAVIPVAGLGTRFLPATKAMPKEMLPVVDKPVIQFVVEEAEAAGINDVLMVTGRNKNALENHFDRAFELETRLGENGDISKLQQVEESTLLANIHYVRQGDSLGLGHAVSKASVFIGNEPFLLLLGDEIIHKDPGLIPRMTREATERQASIVALMEVPDSEVGKYGIAELGEQLSEGLFVLHSLIEKPELQNAPSRFAVVGRYVLQPEVFSVLENLEPGKNGEYQLTDALSIMAGKSRPEEQVLGVVISGQRFDMGNQLSFLQSTVMLALERTDFGDDFRDWLKTSMF